MSKVYVWWAMKNGALMSGMYTQSSRCASPEVARCLAKPQDNNADGYGLCEVWINQHGELQSTVILEVVAR